MKEGRYWAQTGAFRKKKVAGDVSSGLINLHMKGLLAGKPFAISRNQPSRGGGGWWAGIYAVAQSRTQLK